MGQPSRTTPAGLVRSYLFMRRGVGIIGVALPFVLVFGYAIGQRSVVFRPSISDYYYTDMRNVFVGSLCAIGIFLICYRFSWQEDVLSSIAGVLAIAVAWCPTVPDNPTANAVLAGRAHYICAAILFLILASFCFWLFPRLDPTMAVATPRKKLRNIIYRVCGGVIIVSVALAGASHTSLFPSSFGDGAHLVLWCESIAIFAFGTSWLIKGETLLTG